MNLVSRLRRHLVKQGIVSADQEASLAITLVIGDVPRDRGKLTRRYIVSRGDVPQLSIKFIPQPWGFAFDDIVKTRAVYGQCESFRVPQFIGHFASPEGHFFVEEHLRPAVSLASLVRDGTVTPREATEIISGILSDIWKSGRKPSESFVRSEKNRYRDYLQRFVNTGLLADVTAEYLERIIDAHRADLRRVWSAGDIIDRNIVQSNGSWYLLDFEYAHETLFLFKEAFRSILNSEWARELSLAQICPFLGDFPEAAARLLALAWERHLYSLVLDPHADATAHENLSQRFWHVFGAGVVYESKQDIAAAEQELATTREHVRRLEEALQTQAAQLAHSEAQVNDLQSQREGLAAEAATLRGLMAQREESARDLETESRQLRAAYESTQAHARGLEAEISRLQIEQGNLQAHARNLEAEITGLQDERGRLKGAAARAHALEAELAQVRMAQESTLTHARSLEAEVSRLQIEQGNLQAHARNLAAEITRLQDERGRWEEAAARARALEADLAQVRVAQESTLTHACSLEAEVSRLRIEQGNLQAHIRNLEADLGRLRNTEARAQMPEADVGRLQSARDDAQAQVRDLRAEITRLRDDERQLNEQMRTLEDIVEAQRAQNDQQVAAAAHAQEMLVEREQQCARQAAELSSVERLTDSFRIELAGKEEQLRQRQLELEEKSRQLAEREQQVAALLGSRSWRLTRPLRWLPNQVRALLKQRSVSGSTASRQGRTSERDEPRPLIHSDTPNGSTVADSSDNPLRYHVDVFRIVRNPFGSSKTLEVSGWCFAPGHPYHVRLELRADGHTLLECICNLERKDVADAFGREWLTTTVLPFCGFREMVELGDGPYRQIELITADDHHTLAQGSVEQLEVVEDPATADTECDGHRVSLADFVRQVHRQARAKVNYRTALSPTKWRQWLRRTVDEYQLYRVESQMAASPAVAEEGTASAAAVRVEAPDPPVDYTALDGRRLKVACFTHNLNLEGATKVLLDTALGLSASRRIAPVVVSPFDGPARQRMESHGVPCHLIRLQGTENILAGWRSKHEYRKSVETVCAFLTRERPDVVIANVVNNFFVIEAASRLSIPSLWLIHESYDRATMMRNVNPFVLAACERAFAQAHRVVFPSMGTSELYRRYNRAGNFRVVHNALHPAEVEAGRQGVSQHQARCVLGVRSGAKVIVSVGTVCQRKDQATLARALGLLAQKRSDFQGYIVGARDGDPYVRVVERIIEGSAARDHVTLVRETHDVHTYYRAADVFAFSSLNECFPLVILEAMAHGLPIVTTKCIGVTEQVRFGANALSFEFGDAEGLAKQLELLLDDPERRESMGQQSRDILAEMQTYEQMIQTYENLLSGGA